MGERPIFHDWKHAFDDDFERKRKVSGITKRQRDWLRRAWATVFQIPEGLYVCSFPIVKDEGFFLHGFVEEVQWHHVVPRGYASYVLGWDDARINHPKNLVPLCKHHHVAYKQQELDYHNQVVPAIHPDIEWGRKRYRGGKNKPTTFDKVFSWRTHKMNNKEEYWNTDWDMALVQKAEEVYYNYLNYLLEHGLKDPWPERK